MKMELIILFLKTLDFYRLIKESGQIFISISDKLLEKKLKYFLEGFQNQNISEEQKIKFLSKYSGEDYAERIVFIIDRLESAKKIKIIGELFYQVFTGYLTIEEFERLSFATLHLCLLDIDILLKSPKELQFVPRGTASLFCNLHLLEQAFFIMDEAGIDIGNPMKYYVSRLGIKYARIALNQAIEYKDYSQKEFEQALGWNRTLNGESSNNERH